VRPTSMKRFAKALTLAALLAAPACAAPNAVAAPRAVVAPSTVAPPPAPLIGTRWIVDTLYTGQHAAPAPAGAEAHLTFDAHGRVRGTGGCNGLGGNATIGRRTIGFSEIITTMMACGGARDTLEHAVVAVLNQGSVGYRRTGNHLTLRTAERGLRLHVE
jgi:heat shock protein HslJ